MHNLRHSMIPRSRSVLMKAFPHLYRQSLIRKNVVGTNPRIMIDVGCGEGAIIRCFRELGGSTDTSYIVGLDLFYPYLLRSKAAYDDVMLCDIRRLPLRNECCDVALLIEVIEHLKKSDGTKLLDELEALCTGTILVATHVGFSGKSELEDQNPFQAHRSGWVPEEFEGRGYSVHGFGGFSFLRDEKGKVLGTSKFNHIVHRLFTVITQVFTYSAVRSAYEMFCIKRSAFRNSSL